MNMPATLDPLLHQPLRTQLAAYLAARGEATFAELKRALAATDGNLDAHLTKLLEAGYLESRKEAAQSGRAPTVFSLSAAGRQAFTDYVGQLSRLFESAAPGEAASSAAPVAQGG